MIGDERLPHAASQLGANRDVLQIRIDRRKPARGGDGLIVVGVDPAGARVDLQRQTGDIGRFKLAERLVFENSLDDRMLVLDAFQHVGID